MEEIGGKAVEHPESEVIYNAIAKVIDNPEYTQYLTVITNKDKTISIRAKSFLCAKIKLTHKIRYILVNSKHIEEFKDYLNSHHSQESLTEEVISDEFGKWIRIPVNSLDDVLSLIKSLSIIYMHVISEFAGEGFGCCWRFIQCSDERKCVNPNLLMSFACAYKRNLDAGRIFYGKNKNI